LGVLGDAVTDPDPPGPPAKEGDSLRGRWALAVLAAAAFLGVVLGYYFSHKPISASGAAAVLAVFGDVALALFLVTVAGGLGRRILGSAPPGPTVGGLVIQSALGLGVMAMSVLALLWIGVFRQPVAWLTAIVVALVSGKSSLRWLEGWRTLQEYRPKSGWERAAAVAVVLFLVPPFLEALAPPVHFDALVYHLDLPRHFLQTGSLFGPMDNLYWGLPLTGEMVYTLAAGLGRPQTAAVVGFAAAALTCVGIFALASEIGRPAGWVSLIALLSGPSIASAAGWGYVDWWAGLFGFALIAILLHVHQASPLRWVAVAGVMAGFAAGSKYTAALAIPAGLVAIVFASPTRRGLRFAVLFLVAAMTVLLPWLLKNVAGTGAPLYPYLGTAANISPARQSAVVSSVPAPPLGQSLAAPLAATLYGHEQAPGFASDIGPLLLALLPGLVFLSATDLRRILPLGAYLLTAWGLWAAASQFSGLLIQTRLYFVLMPAWAVLAGCGFLGYTRLSLGSVRVGRVVAALVVFVAGLSLYSSLRAGVEANALAVLVGSEKTDAYITRRLGDLYPIQQGLGRLPPGSNTLMLWEPRGFYCPVSCGADAWIDEWFVARRMWNAPEAIRAAWIERGFTHLLLFHTGREFVQAEDERYPAEDWEALDALLRGLTEVDAVGDAYSLFRLD
jgi:hypothetical protein